MKRFLSWALLFVPFSLYCSLTLGADPIISLTLDDAVERALEQNLSLKKNLIDLSTADYAAKHLWSEVFPAISIGAGLSYGTGLFIGNGFELDSKNAGYNVQAGITLSLNAGIPQAMKIIKLAYQTQLLTYEDARRQLEVRITKTFYTLIANRENLSHLAEMLELAERQLEKNRVSFNNGLVSRLTWLNSQLAVETAKYNLSTAQAAYTNQLGEFLVSLGMEQKTEAALEGELTIVSIEADPEALIREYLPKRPDIAGQRQTIERLEYLEKQTALSARAPSLSLSAQWRLGSPGAAQGGFTGDPTDSLSGSASISIPIESWIPGTTRNQAIRTAGTNIEKARLDLKNTEDSAAANIRSLTANLRNSRDSLEIARLREEIAGQAYELTEQGFRSGTVESLALEESRNSWATARQQVLQSELAYQTMILDLAAALNVDWKTFARSDR
jgi:multidrug efflux system outer membrane protein